MRLRLAIALLAGALLPLAFAPFDYFYIAWPCVAVLFFLWRDARPSQAFCLGGAFGLSSFLIGIYWTYISVHEFGGAPIALSMAATLGLVVVLAFFVGAAGWLAARLSSGQGSLAWLGTMPAAWVLTEWCRGWIFTGFGWLSLGYSQTDTWLMAYAPVFGLHAMSYAAAVTAGGLVALVFGSRRGRGLGLLAIASVWLTAWALGTQDWTESRERSVTVALAQGSVTQDIKWLPEQFPATLALYRELTVQSAGRQLIVWPEVAIPNLYEAVTAYLDEIRELAAVKNGTIVLGILKRDVRTGGAQNAVVALTDVPQFYVKRHLVPFGEYFPVPDFVRGWLRALDLPYTDVSAGTPEQPLLAVAGEQVAVTICYEDVFGIEQLDALPRATLLINVSNDAWFGDSFAAHQHLQIARVRAAEVGRYLLRTTNTGITAIIDPRGAVVSRARQFEPEVLFGSVEGFTGATPYVIWRNYPVLLCAFVLLLAGLPATRRSPRKRTTARP